MQVISAEFLPIDNINFTAVLQVDSVSGIYRYASGFLLKSVMP